MKNNLTNREYYLYFLDKHSISPNKLADLMGLNKSGLFAMRHDKRVKDSFIIALKNMNKVKELTGEFLDPVKK